MKKSTAITIIVSVGLIFLGALIFVAAYSSIDFDFIRFSTVQPDDENQITEKIEITGNEDIYIHLYEKNITIDVSPDEYVYFEYSNSQNSFFDFTNEGSKISLIEKNTNQLNNNVFSLFQFNIDFYGTKQSDVTVYIPKNFGGNIKINSTSGRKKIDNIAVNNLQVSSTSGSVFVSNIIAINDVAITGTSGRIDANEIISTNGDITVTGTTNSKTLSNMSAQNITINSTSGILEANMLISDILKITGTTNRKYLTDIISREISINATSGNTELHNVLAVSMNISSTTGRIKGTLKGFPSDYHIVSKTTTGSNSLEQYTNLYINAEQMLNISTTSGSIKLGFEE